MRIREAARIARMGLLDSSLQERDMPGRINGYAWEALAMIARADGRPVPLAPWDQGPERREFARARP